MKALQPIVISGNLVIEPMATGHYAVSFTDTAGVPFVRDWRMSRRELSRLAFRLRHEGFFQTADLIEEVLQNSGW